MVKLKVENSIEDGPLEVQFVLQQSRMQYTIQWGKSGFEPSTETRTNTARRLPGLTKRRRRFHCGLGN
jgi:hypothetical protein